MKSFQALGRALFLVLLLDGIQCRTLHGKLNCISPSAPDPTLLLVILEDAKCH